MSYTISYGRNPSHVTADRSCGKEGIIHFDNDEPGRTAGERLRAALQDRQIESVLQYPPMGCKDVNDYLVAVREYDAKKEKEKQAEAGL